MAGEGASERVDAVEDVLVLHAYHLAVGEVEDESFKDGSGN